jgi:hypothetical protein
VATLPDLSSFTQFLDEATEETLTIPIRGKQYTWKAGDLSVTAMLLIQRVEATYREIAAKLAADQPIDPTLVVLTDAEDQRLMRELIGEATLGRLADDGVKWHELQHIVSTLSTWHLRGEQAAREKWARGEGEPERPPAVAASTKTAGSSTTRTTPRRSGGRKSSPTGRSSKPTSTASTAST